jgi:hypothetical protein
MYTNFKVKYNTKRTLCSIIPLEKETSTLMVDSKEEDKDEVWIEIEVKSSVITVHIQDT